MPEKISMLCTKLARFARVVLVRLFLAVSQNNNNFFFALHISAYLIVHTKQSNSRLFLNRLFKREQVLLALLAIENRRFLDLPATSAILSLSIS